MMVLWSKQLALTMESEQIQRPLVAVTVVTCYHYWHSQGIYAANIFWEPMVCPNGDTAVNKTEYLPLLSLWSSGTKNKYHCFIVIIVTVDKEPSEQQWFRRLTTGNNCTFKPFTPITYLMLAINSWVRSLFEPIAQTKKQWRQSTTPQATLCLRVGDLCDIPQPAIFATNLMLQHASTAQSCTHHGDNLSYMIYIWFADCSVHSTKATTVSESRIYILST